jgi:hypothetical protein
MRLGGMRDQTMRYTSFRAARAAMSILNRGPRSHPPAAVYFADGPDEYWTVVRAWHHHDRDGLVLILAPCEAKG